MITVRTKTTASVKEVIRFFNRNFPEAILKARLFYLYDSLPLIYVYYIVPFNTYISVVYSKLFTYVMLALSYKPSAKTFVFITFLSFSLARQ